MIDEWPEHELLLRQNGTIPIGARDPSVYRVRGTSTIVPDTCALTDDSSLSVAPLRLINLA